MSILALHSSIYLCQNTRTIGLLYTIVSRAAADDKNQSKILQNKYLHPCTQSIDIINPTYRDVIVSTYYAMLCICFLEGVLITLTFADYLPFDRTFLSLITIYR